MATHSSILAWEISWTGEPGRLRKKEGEEGRKKERKKEEREKGGKEGGRKSLF